MRSNNSADNKFFSASLMLGKWKQLQTATNLDNFTRLIKYEIHFSNNRQNFFNLLKRETIEKMIPNLLCFEHANQHLTEE